MNQSNHINHINHSTDILLTPENAVGQTGSSDPKYVLQLNKFQGVYQYGSDFEEMKCKQDGVAPQVRINGLGEGRNAHIPMRDLLNPYTGKYENIRKFNDAHYVKNFYWVFSESLRVGKVIKRN